MLARTAWIPWPTWAAAIGTLIPRHSAMCLTWPRTSSANCLSSSHRNYTLFYNLLFRLLIVRFFFYQVIDRKKNIYPWDWSFDWDFLALNIFDIIMQTRHGHDLENHVFSSKLKLLDVNKFCWFYFKFMLFYFFLFFH